MSELELQRRIAELESQNLALITENKKLQEALGLPSEVVVEPVQQTEIQPDNDVAFNKYMSLDEKIELFMSLFRGRTDVYAKRCYSKNCDSSYYIPLAKMSGCGVFVKDRV